MNVEALSAVLIIVACLQVKHFICDGPLQTYAMVKSKGHYGQALGLIHSLIHGAGTFLVLELFAPVTLALAVGLAAVDFVVHYHIDFCKETLNRRAGWTTADSVYWWAYAADQTLHQLTYLVLVYYALKPV